MEDPNNRSLNHPSDNTFSSITHSKREMNSVIRIKVSCMVKANEGVSYIS